MMESVLFAPETVGELIDRLGFMVLTAPDFKSSVTPNESIESAFASVQAGLGNLCPKFGEPHCSDLHAMADESKSYLEEGKLKEGLFRLQDMIDFLTQKKWKAS